jgi:hypothetical protein
MAERLTWNQVQGANFSGANEASRMATALLSSASMPLVAGIEGFQDAIGAQQSAQLRQRVMAQQDPAAAAAALADGSMYEGLNPRYLSPDSMEFAAGQAQRLLNEDQTAADIVNTNARTGLVGVQTETGRYNLGRARIEDERGDARYEAGQALEPIMQQVDTLARAGDIAGAQALVQANAGLFREADVDLAGVYDGISTQATGGRGDVTNTDAFNETLRGYGVRDDARAIVDAAVESFGTRAEAENAIRQAMAADVITPEAAASALAVLGQNEGNLFRTPTAAEEFLAPYGITLPGQAANNDWLAGFQSRMEQRESGGVGRVNSLGIAAGTAQLTQPRMQDLIDAGVLPAGTTVDNFGQLPEETQAAANTYHFEDLNNTYERNGYDRYVGQVINGVEITREGILAAAHLSGWGGVDAYLSGEENRQDGYGTSVADYMAQFGNGNAALPPGMGQVGLDFGSAVPRTEAEMARDAMERAAAERTASVDALVADSGEALARTAQEAAGTTPALSTGTAPQLAQGDAAQVAAARRMQEINEGPNYETTTPAEAEAAQLAADMARLAEMDTQIDNMPVAVAARSGLMDERNALRDSVEERQAVIASQTPEGRVADIRPANHNYGESLLADNAQIGALLTEGVVNTVSDVATSVNTAINPAIEYMFGVPNFFGAASRLDVNNDGYGSSPLGALTGQSELLAPEERAAVNARDGIADAEAQTAAAAGLSEQPTTGTETGAPVQYQMESGILPDGSIRPVNPEDLQLALRTVENTFTVDQSVRGLADVSESYESLPDATNPGAMANALVADDGALAGMDQNLVREMLLDIMNETGVRNPRIAAAFLVNSKIEAIDSWVPFEDNVPDANIEQITTLMRQFAGGDPTVQNLTAAMTRGQQVGDATAALAEVRGQYDQAVALIAEAAKTDPAQARALEQIMTERVFPIIRERLVEINNTGLAEANAAAATGN